MAFGARRFRSEHTAPTFVPPALHSPEEAVQAVRDGGFPFNGMMALGEGLLAMVQQ